MRRVTLLMPFVLSMAVVATNIDAGEFKQGDKIKIITPETVARLCPHPNCGENQHIIRIPQGTTLTIEGITSVKSGRLPPVKWFEVKYKGNRGWVSIFDTNAQ